MRISKTILSILTMFLLLAGISHAYVEKHKNSTSSRLTSGRTDRVNTAQNNSIRHIFFIDTRVPDYEILISEFPEKSKWFLLEPGQDGIEKIQSALSA